VIGADCISTTLADLGVRYVFGLPGTQNTALYEALRKTGLRRIVPSDEGAAAFMATGYSRATGGVGVLTTIPGPGFLYALPGVAEARDDSAALVWLTFRQPDDGQAFPLQKLDQAAIAAPLVKRCVHLHRIEDLEPGLRAAFAAAQADEPGPVLVEVSTQCLRQETVWHGPVSVRATAPVGEAAARVAALLERSSRPLIYAGQGAQGAASKVQDLAHRLQAPVLFTCSGRGVLPDADALAFVRDFSIGVGAVVPTLVERADLILALGCKFTHNGSNAGRLRLPAEKLVRVDASAAVLAANYPASLAVHARVEDVLAALDALPVMTDLGPSGWHVEELRRLRTQLHAENSAPIDHEPVLVDCARAPLAEFFRALSSAMGPRVVYTADAGLHQALTRRYANVVQPRGLLCPSDFQSMGFGLPGAIAAALARPDDRIVACIGDGALALSAAELLTAVREQIDLTVIVFNDQAFGLIRRQQLADYGHASGVDLHNPDFAALASAVGCSYFLIEGDLGTAMKAVARQSGVRLVELRLHDAASLHVLQAKRVVTESLRAATPPGLWRMLKRALRR
jgi:acetolactate synthase I/II/III large subunit